MPKLVNFLIVLNVVGGGPLTVL